MSEEPSQELSSLQAYYSKIEADKAKRPSLTYSLISLLRLYFRRYLNQLFPRKNKSKKAKKKRQGTSARSTRFSKVLGLFGLFVGIGFAAIIGSLYGYQMASKMFRHHLRQSIEQKDSIKIRGSFEEIAFYEIQKSPARMREFMLSNHLSGRKVLALKTGTELSPIGKKALKHWNSAYRKHGAEIFIPKRLPQNPFNQKLWAKAIKDGRILKSYSISILIVLFTILILGLGYTNTELSKAHWSFESFYSLPISRLGLMISKLFQYSFVNPFPILAMFPLLAIGPLLAQASLSSALIHSLCYAVSALLFLASSKLAIECFLRKKASQRQSKNLQALCTIAGTVSLYIVLYLCTSQEGLPQWFQQFSEISPAWISNLPLLQASHSLIAEEITDYPLFWFSRELELPITIAFSSLWAMGCVALACFWTRNGLLRSAAEYESKGRKRQDLQLALPSSQAAFHSILPKPSLSSGLHFAMLKKEVLLLLRDKAFLAQSTLVPIAVIGFQLSINPRMLDAAIGDSQHAAMLAFGFCAYVALFGGLKVIGSEIPSLWFLASFPGSLCRRLLQKSFLWAGFASLFMLALYAFLVAAGAQLDFEFIEYGLYSLVGVIIFAFMISGLGIIGIDLSELKSNTRPMKPSLTYVYLLLGSTFSMAIYAPNQQIRLSMFLTYIFVTLAIWNLVRARLPYLLDPYSLPKKEIGLTNASVTWCFTYSFSCLLFIGFSKKQSLLADVKQISLTLPSLTFSASAVAIGIASLVVLFARKIPKLNQKIGLKASDLKAGLLTLPLWSLIGICLAGIGGIAYSWAHWKLMPWQRLGAIDLAGNEFAITLGILLAGSPFIIYVLFGLLLPALSKSLKPLQAAIAMSLPMALAQAFEHWPIFLLVGFCCALASLRQKQILSPWVLYASFMASYYTLIFLMEKS